MPPRLEDEWSDSEDENVSEVGTSVLLGIPDGEIDELPDLSDPAVSRIGGLPVFLPSRPLPSSSSHCKSCSLTMPLLVQMWCPFEGSAMDRVLYVWGCGRPECQRKPGSVRAWRGIKFNHRYAAKLEKMKAREAEKSARKAEDAARKAEEKKRQGVNPFSGGGTTQMDFGLGTQLFGGPVSREKPIESYHEEEGAVSEPESNDDSSDDAVDGVAAQLESVSLQSLAVPADWSSSPSYKPVYLSTISEYISPPFKSKKESRDFPDEDAKDAKASKDWGLEGWESSVEVDAVFERFVRRVSHENEQCVRYDLKGTPLPFGSRDAVYDRLFPPPPPAPFTTKPGYAAPIVKQRTFNPDTIEKCAACRGRRVFECQLMPNLINVLRDQGQRPGPRGESEEPKVLDDVELPHQSLEDRKREMESEMKTGMEWGSCFIFSCAEDCCGDGDEGWKEELVLIQWDE